ncbi:4-hydroxy-tetrahydrodipicolinate synthase [Actinomycetospora sp. NBRC 106375]|uniref:4-hydroxy-tetrahydrodipicolinate synthase n=1 Tax=Actinomycetospora sp. NBRC 106375 TaxID=3032207 RepID=UPI002557B997|nr:4-hydroxy-tetrahydrodipicolinate synthase [Actinomycetospora sp. NBRC 106375]
MTLGAVLTAIVTPFAPDGSVDEQAFVDLMGHLYTSGTDGLVVCGTTGEASTLSTEEHLRLVELAVEHRPASATVVASTGSNDTRHACEMTEKATAVGADAILSVTPYYNKPNRRGLVAHYTEVARATDKPVVLYNIPSRVVLDLDNAMLAELAQIERIDYVKQANNANLAPVDGLQIYAGNDDLFGSVLEMGGCGGILVASHVVGPAMRRMVDEPDQRAEIEASLKPVFDALGVTTNPIPIKAALDLVGHPVGGLRLPMVPADSREREVVRAALAGVGVL